jgi:hypothetical protein
MWLLKSGNFTKGNSTGNGYGDSTGHGNGYGNRYGTGYGYNYSYGSGYGHNYGNCNGHGRSNTGPTPDHLLLLAALQGGHYVVT